MKVVATSFLNSIFRFATVLPLLWLCLPASADQAAYAICGTCHGANGEGNVALNSPAIAGQESWYLTTQINNFKSGARGTHKDDMYGLQMRPMAMTLADDAAVAKVAAYVSAMSPKPMSATVTGNADAGKALYMICAACHGADGKGQKAMNGPNLTIQQDWYLVRQLQNYKSGARGADPKDVLGQQMRPMAMTLANDQAINDVVAYINTLR